MRTTKPAMSAAKVGQADTTLLMMNCTTPSGVSEVNADGSDFMTGFGFMWHPRSEPGVRLGVCISLRDLLSDMIKERMSEISATGTEVDK